MKTTADWWHRMFEMHTHLMTEYDGYVFREFRKQLDTIPYEYANATKGLGEGAYFIKEIAGWFEDVAGWLFKRGKYKDAEKYLERALDYYCDPELDFNDDYIDHTKTFMRIIVSHRRNYTYDGEHEIYEED